MKHAFTLLLVSCWLSYTLLAQINWQPTYGPEGGFAGYIYQNKEMASVNSRLLFSTYNKGVMYLDPFDRKIKPANNGLISAAVYHLKADSKRLWAACGNGIFSYDLAQQHWDTISNIPIPQYNYTEITTSPNGVITTLERLGNLFYISFDGGISWIERLFPETPTSKLFWEGESLYMMGDSYCWVTKDYGISWTEVGLPLGIVVSFNGKYYKVQFGRVECANTLTGPWVKTSNAPKNAYKIYSSGDRLFCVAFKSTQSVLYSSADGVNWQYSNDGLKWRYGSADPLVPSYNYGLYFKNGRYIFWEPDLDGIFISLDTCRTWLPVEKNLFSTLVCIDTTLYVGGTGGGVLKSGFPQQYGALSIGRIFKDDNNNGQYDVGEVPLTRTKVSLYESGAWYPFWYDFTDENGYYHLGSLPNASDTIRPHINTPYVSSITPPYHLVTGSASGRDFAIKLLENVTDAEVSHHLLGVPRPGFKINGHVTLSNRGTIPVSGRLGVKFDPTYHHCIEPCAKSCPHPMRRRL